MKKPKGDCDTFCGCVISRTISQSERMKKPKGDCDFTCQVKTLNN